MQKTFRARIFRNGANQAVRIPRNMELPGKEVTIHQERNRLIIEPVKTQKNLLEVLADLSPIEEDFPDIDEVILPLDDIVL